jgi:hypothetical protein
VEQRRRSPAQTEGSMGPGDRRPGATAGHGRTWVPASAARHGHTTSREGSGERGPDLALAKVENESQSAPSDSHTIACPRRSRHHAATSPRSRGRASLALDRVRPAGSPLRS